MEEVEVEGKKIFLFENAEELKWYFHTQLCKGNAHAEYMMNRIMEEDLAKPCDLNLWLASTPYRVKEA